MDLLKDPYTALLVASVAFLISISQQVMLRRLWIVLKWILQHVTIVSPGGSAQAELHAAMRKLGIDIEKGDTGENKD